MPDHKMCTGFLPDDEQITHEYFLSVMSNNPPADSDILHNPTRRINAFSILFFSTILAALLLSCHTGKSKINITSINLSHRIVLLDTVETRLNLIIGFSISPDFLEQPEKMKASAELSLHGAVIATSFLPKLDFYGGDLNFYLPFNISPGNYDLQINLYNITSNTKLIAQHFIIKNIETISCRETAKKSNWMHPRTIPLANPPKEISDVLPSQDDQKRGFLLWHRNPLRYVYPNSAPKQNDIIKKISIQLARHEYEPATFSLYGLKNLGKVTVTLSKLTGKTGNTLAPPEIFTVKTVPRIKNRSAPVKTCELRPRLLLKVNTSVVTTGQSQRFWLSLHAAEDTLPGRYTGRVFITTGLGRTAIPIQVRVLPFTLTERPDKEYGFMMTYVFQEMTSGDLSDQQRQKIYDNGLRYYRSLKEHGLTAVCPHSSFTLQRMPDGTPNLRDLQSALKAFNEVGFSGPFIYYCAHLVHNAKPGWAGSTLNFDYKRHPALMQEIITYAKKHFPEMKQANIYWMPGDEVQDDGNGPDRTEITKSLLHAINELGEKTAITVWEKTPWKTDIQLGGPQPASGEHWQYPNELTTVPDTIDDATSIRRTFGLADINNKYTGLLPWTFQTSENAAGNPYSDLDNNGRAEVMIAYPGTEGPISTPEYEAIREGIDDGRYAWLLETEIKNALTSSDPLQQRLARQAEAIFKNMSAHAEQAGPETMDDNRRTMTYWILQLHSSAPSFSGTVRNN